MKKLTLAGTTLTALLLAPVGTAQTPDDPVEALARVLRDVPLDKEEGTWRKEARAALDALVK